VEKAKALAQAYADTYLEGYTVETVLPFAGRHGTTYSVGLKGLDDEMRVLHVNPFGAVNAVRRSVAARRLVPPRPIHHDPRGEHPRGSSGFRPGERRWRPPLISARVSFF
jgi:hypothetical protein